MKKQIPAIILAVISIVLAVALNSSRQEINKLQQEITALLSSKSAEIPQQQIAATDNPAPAVQQVAEAVVPPETEEPPEKEAAGQRMMSSLSKMMENPTMNKVMEASQRGAVGALYSDMIEYLNLDAKETEFFMDLLMFRQMKNVDLAMKMMSGNLSEEEQQALKDEIKEAAELTKEEMKKFLNNPDDFAEWEFYEKTMGERMMLSQMDQSLSTSDDVMSDETYRALLGMMHDEKQNYDFTTDLHDEKNTDMSPERFSKENLQNFSNDMNALNNRIIEKARSMLSPEQLKAFEEAIKATMEMQEAQLEMAGQMFGGKQN